MAHCICLLPHHTPRTKIREREKKAGPSLYIQLCVCVSAGLTFGMSDSSLPQGRRDAAQRFYQNQRSFASRSQPAGPADRETVATAASDGAGTSCNVASPHVREDAVDSLDSLAAFLNSREESAVELLAGFTQLTPQDKLKALAQLEGAALSNASDAAEPGNGEHKANTRHVTPKPVADYAELHRRLQEQERQQQRTQQQPARRHVDEHNMPQPFTTQSTSGAVNHDVTACVNNDDDLETLELGDGTRTGNLVVFFEQGVADVSTSFDNYFGVAAESISAARVGGTHSCELPSSAVPTSSPAVTTAPMHNAQSALLTLDEILALDSEGEQELGMAQKTSASSPQAHTPENEEATPAPHTESGLEVSGDQVSGRRASSSTSSSLTDVSSVALPGLDDLEDGYAEHASTPPDSKRANISAIDADLAAHLHQVIAEHDDCVQTFALDPLFDYDADVLGEAFRSEKTWRQ